MSENEDQDSKPPERPSSEEVSLLPDPSELRYDEITYTYRGPEIRTPFGIVHLALMHVEDEDAFFEGEQGISLDADGSYSQDSAQTLNDRGMYDTHIFLQTPVNPRAPLLATMRLPRSNVTFSSRLKFAGDLSDEMTDPTSKQIPLKYTATAEEWIAPGIEGANVLFTNPNPQFLSELRFSFHVRP